MHTLSALLVSALLASALLACGADASDRVPDPPARQLANATLPTAAAPPEGVTAPAGPSPRAAETAIVRGLYVNRWATQSPNRMRRLIAIADSTEINALVLDLKDEFGLNYTSSDSVARRNSGNAGTIPQLTALLDTLRTHGITSIARLVVFKDSVAARINPEHTIRRPDGEVWRDKEGLAWVNPYDRLIQEYNIRVAEELARMGFDEIQFDYIRFPEPYRSLPRQVFPGSDGSSKAQALASFLGRACPRINKAGARCTADVFGLVTTVEGPLEIGQHWELLAPVTDVLLPMVYPSHYPRGAFGVARPNADPYTIVHSALSRARERNEKLGIADPEHVRAWLQAFSLGQPPYGPAEIEAQKRAVYAAGFDGWILWHPGTRYEPVLSALERKTVSRKSTPDSAAEAATNDEPK